jgi:hypothetical protein
MGVVVVMPRWVLVALGVAALVLVGAVGWYTLPPQRGVAPPPPLASAGPARTAPTPEANSPEAERLRAVGDALQSLQLGMRRVEVEGILGRPDPGLVGPVQRAGDRATFSTRYPAFVTGQLWFAPEVRGRCEAVLEYDATRPGHPLVRLSCNPSPATPPGAVSVPGIPM